MAVLSEEATHNKEVEGLEGIIQSKRYKIARRIGEGTWGKVYSAVDALTGEKVAIKVLDPSPLAARQMDYRNISAEKAIMNESRKLKPCAHIVPGFIETDEEDKPFIVMPEYKKFLSDKLDDGVERKYLNHGLTKEDVNNTLLGIARGISETHSLLNRAHSDIKPDNIALDNYDERPLLNDLGTSTCASLSGATVSPRDNMGFLQTRAPECFDEKSHPTREADAYSFFSLSYRIMTGKYPFEDELNSNPEFFKEINPKDFKLSVKKKLKKIPRTYRKILEECSSFKPSIRPWSGASIVDGVKRAIDNQNALEVLKKHARRAFYIMAPLALAAYATYKIKSIPEKEVIPANIKAEGLLYLESPKETPIVFSREDLSSLKLPKPYQDSFMTYGFAENIARYATKNRSAAFLLNAYNSAVWARRCTVPDHHQVPDNLSESEADNPNYYSEGAFINWMVHYKFSERTKIISESKICEFHLIVAKSIEHALSQSRKSDGTCDLEDTLAISLLGENRVNSAKKYSGSPDFIKYVDAKDKKGNYLIGRDEKDFLKAWLSQVYYADNPRLYSYYPDSPHHEMDEINSH